MHYGVKARKRPSDGQLQYFTDGISVGILPGSWPNEIPTLIPLIKYYSSPSQSLIFGNVFPISPTRYNIWQAPYTKYLQPGLGGWSPVYLLVMPDALCLRLFRPTDILNGQTYTDKDKDRQHGYKTLPKMTYSAIKVLKILCGMWT